MEQLIIALPQIAIGIGTAVATIIGVLKTNGSKMDRMSDGLASLSQDISRLTLHDEHLAITERLAAGERYMKSGGNGAALAYYEKLLAEYKEGLVL
jgi:hypothetical protein